VTHRERVAAALNHDEPDRVPVDFGATGVTLVHGNVYRGMLERLRWDEEPDAVSSRLHGMIEPGERLKQFVDADCRSVGLEGLEHSAKDFIDENSYLDEWGVLWKRAEAGEFAPTRGPLQSDDLTPADLESYDWPDPADPERYPTLASEVGRLRRETDFAVVFDFHYGVVRECQRLRGFTEWLEDLLVEPALAEALMEKVTYVVEGIARDALSEVGDGIDVFLWYDDLGFQDRSYMRPELYRKMVKPHHRRFVEAVRGLTGAKVMLHSDGSIRELLPDLIEIGVDVINPVQVSAKGMDSTSLKATFGNNLSFWGAIDTQSVLPFGTPADVEREVRRRIGDLAPGGGYVLASGHNIQAEVPAENVLAMFEAARRFGHPPSTQAAGDSEL
jgi:uroporphyrinogen decarboxylase